MRHSWNSLCLALLLPLAALSVPWRAVLGGAPVAADVLALDEETLIGRRHFSSGYPARNPDRSVNAVIEIPAGTTAKFEVDEASGWLRWSLKREDGSRREIDYLPYPINYGMVPRTMAGDGDPIDITVLGRGLERGGVLKTRIIGVLKMGPEEARDDKLLAVPVEPALRNGFSRVHSLAELDHAYPASRQILTMWFAHYWGLGATHIIGWGEVDEANELLDQAMIDSAALSLSSIRRAAWANSDRPAGSALRPPATAPSAGLAD